ncbi:MAG TPA: chorismate mutase [Candidatus Saccharimonadales bacterium]|nr:chorismate mutase [Candidatus Saccharimonadales bacterium]
MTGEPKDRMAELREEMTAVTEEIVLILNKRSRIALAIGEEKARRGTAQVRDLGRERQVLDRVAEINEGPLPDEAVQRVVQVAMDVSSELQAATAGLPIGESAPAQIPNPEG